MGNSKRESTLDIGIRLEPRVWCKVDLKEEMDSRADCLQTFTLRHNVASLAVLYPYFHANCSYELANCMSPPSLPHTRPCWTRLSTHSHPHSAHLSYARVNSSIFTLSSTFLIQELTSIFTLPSLLLVNCGTLYLNAPGYK